MIIKGNEEADQIGKSDGKGSGRGGKGEDKVRITTSSNVVYSLCPMSGLMTRSLGLNTLGTSGLKPRHRLSLSAVCPRKLSWDLGLESHPKDWRSPGSNPRPLV